eukprot:ANDGO_05365.mRNA.1 hypothetical protein
MNDLLGVLYCEFDNDTGPKLVYSHPSNALPSEVFDACSEYVITRSAVSTRVISCRPTPHLHLVGVPIYIEGAKYRRNALIFNGVFVFRIMDLEFDPILAARNRYLASKFAYYLKQLEMECAFLSTPLTKSKIPGILQTIYEGLSSTGSAAVPVDDAHVLHFKFLPFCPSSNEDDVSHAIEHGTTNESGNGSGSGNEIEKKHDQSSVHGVAKTLAPTHNRSGSVESDQARSARRSSSSVSTSLPLDKSRAEIVATVTTGATVATGATGLGISHVPILVADRSRTDAYFEKCDLTSNIVFRAIDGVRTVKDIDKVTGVSPVFVRQVISGLMSQGLVRVIGAFGMHNMYRWGPELSLTTIQEAVTLCSSVLELPTTVILALFYSFQPGNRLRDISGRIDHLLRNSEEWSERSLFRGRSLDWRQIVTVCELCGYVIRYHEYPFLLANNVLTPRVEPAPMVSLPFGPTLSGSSDSSTSSVTVRSRLAAAAACGLSHELLLDLARYVSDGNGRICMDDIICKFQWSYETAVEAVRFAGMRCLCR